MKFSPFLSPASSETPGINDANSAPSYSLSIFPAAMTFDETAASTKTGMQQSKLDDAVVLSGVRARIGRESREIK